jgi:hypothetical protein
MLSSLVVYICHVCSEILTRPDCREILARFGHEKFLEVSMQRALYDVVRTSPGLAEDMHAPVT